RLARVKKARRGRPLVLIDIAMPRDVEPACGDLDWVYLYNIDDLQKAAADGREGRQSEAQHARSMVGQEWSRFVRASKGRQLGPTITALRARVHAVAKAEAERVAASL